MAFGVRLESPGYVSTVAGPQGLYLVAFDLTGLTSPFNILWTFGDGTTELLSGVVFDENVGGIPSTHVEHTYPFPAEGFTNTWTASAFFVDYDDTASNSGV